MALVSTLRTLRHGPLKSLDLFWLPLERLYRSLNRHVAIVGGVDHMIGGFGPFKLDSHFAFSDFADWGGAHNSGFAACVEACRGARCVLDVGAHIGLVTLPAARMASEGRSVYAFEPASANIRHLRSHVARNKVSNVVVVDALVGAEDLESVRFFEDPNKANGQNAQVIKKSAAAFVASHKRQVTLDRFCKTRGLHPEIIKIDVEGAEVGVLRGAAGILRRDRPRVFLSVHPRELELMGSSEAELVALIDELGYDCREVDGRAVQAFRLDEYILEPRQ